MEITRLKISFGDYRDAAFGTKAQEIYESFIDNANFPDPAPPLKEVNDGITTYKAALAVCGRNYPKVNTMEKNQARASLSTMLKDLGHYAEDTAKYDAAILGTTAFDFYKKRQRITTLSKPEDLKVVKGLNKGWLKVSVKKLAKASGYEVQYAPAGLNGSTVWQSCISLKKTTTIKGLTVGTEYRIQVSGIGSTADRVWSNEVQIYAS